jgi:hypothetical protein
MEIKRCAACGGTFHPRPQTPQQSYCPAEACQRERQRRWRRDKLRQDPDYHENQASAQQAWLKRNSSYWRNYRDRRPDYVERNRTLQRKRDGSTAADGLAKSDVSTPACPLVSGTYRLCLVSGSNLAKIDAWTVEITLLSVG